MNEHKIEDLVTTSDIAKVTGTTNQNIRKVYITNVNGKDKSKMLKALAFGTFFIKNNFTVEEIKLCANIISSMREIKCGKK